MYIMESIGIDATHTALGIEDKGYTDRYLWQVTITEIYRIIDTNRDDRMVISGKCLFCPVKICIG